MALESLCRDVIFNESEFPCLVDSTCSNPKETSNEMEPTSNEAEFTSNEVEGARPPEFVQTDNFLQDDLEATPEVPQTDPIETQNTDNSNPSDSVVVPPNYVLDRDRARRTNVKAPKRFSDEMNLIALAFDAHESDGDEPQSYKQALKSIFYPSL